MLSASRSRDAATGHAAATRGALIEAHLPLARYAVAKVAATIPSHVDREDLLSAAHVALVRAADRYDPAGGASFATYALPRLQGAVLDELRATDWAGRTVRGEARRITAAADVLASELGRPPTTAEVAERVGLTTAEVDKVQLDVHRAVLMSIATPGVTEQLPVDARGPEQSLLKQERSAYLADAIASLPDQLRTVIERSFYGDEPLKAIAADLGVSESRVSQMRSQALGLIRTAMTTMLDARPVSCTGGVRAQKQQQQYLATVAARSAARAAVASPAPAGYSPAAAARFWTAQTTPATRRDGAEPVGPERVEAFG